ncbi:hypothetical protein ASC77_25015 [Nocardioides sp. Root1257]|uniref:hypothetical protein n=1 Tax=unclassified Nocardioides TaxID=2615069 RepID=UPI0006F41757|nr:MULTISPECIES: hypothetical protein [unclassified Nocardioides]KQW50923.1 hypothetical protein ASC77_25015 [Nocardioides sp. Root1257]KRC53719.1 hypothetical protein ASE24_24805 [Nocardioides sp. Root224]
MNRSSKVLIGVGAAVALVVGATGGAVGAQLVTSAQIKNGTIQTVDLNPSVVRKLNQAGPRGPAGQAGSDGSDGADGADGADGVDGTDGTPGIQGIQGPPGPAASDKLGALAADASSTAKTVTNIGGTFGKFTATVRATELDSFTLPAGTYQLTADGFFHSTAAVSGLTRLQLALRINDGTDWGVDVGTCFTDSTSPLADRESSCQTTRVIELAAPTEVLVYAFGYADNQGSADSGKFQAVSHVSAIRVD